ncbi:MAG: STAS domain-containing protein [Armatimonadetes bacterium]|nr:STAS domain-containing protein [Armatimonadota bacterium]
MNLAVNVERADKVTIVDLVGELDAYTSLEVRETVVRLIEEGARDIIINLEKVDFIDSVGLGTLVGCLKRTAEHGGTISLVCANPQIQKVFDITGLSKIFAIYPTRDEAIRRVAPATPSSE